MLDDLLDDRCDTMRRGWDKEGILRDGVFLTPHFGTHFDFTRFQAINDYGILRMRFKFAAF